MAGIIGKVLEIILRISKKIPEKLLCESLEKYLKDFYKNYLKIPGKLEKKMRFFFCRFLVET